MATFEKPKRTVESVPVDLLPVIKSSGVLTDRQFADVKSKVLKGEYPSDSTRWRNDWSRKRSSPITGQAVPQQQVARPGRRPVRHSRPARLGLDGAGLQGAPPDDGSGGGARRSSPRRSSRNERVVARFQREMKLVGRLDHPNVVRAFDADQINRVLYIVMEYVSGESLGKRLRKG